MLPLIKHKKEKNIMERTEVSYKFKKTLYAGKIHLIDVNTKQAVVTGYGSFNTEKLHLLAQFDDNKVISHDSILTVLETTDGYFAPLALRGFHPMGWSTQSFTQSMGQCVHWPTSKGLMYVLEEFTAVHTVINARSEEEILKQKLSNDAEAVLKKTARLSSLGSSTLSYYTVEAGTGYSSTAKHLNTRSGTHIDLSGTMSFKIGDTRGNTFNFLSLRPVLFAFKAYWLMVHSDTDCTIRHLRADSLDFIFTHNKLLAPRTNTPEYRAIITPDTDLHLEILLRCMYFTLNPDGKKRLSQSSKVGLAVSSLIQYAYEERPNLLDHEAISLIAGFQGILESVAQNRARSTHATTKVDTIGEIEKVLSVITSLGDELSDPVKDFYIKDASSIYSLLSRPSFKYSVEAALDELGIDQTKYEDTIAVIDKARQQIVHHQDYDADFLMNLITTGKTDIERDDDGKIVQMAFGVKTGELDNLYDLTLEMTRRYFDRLQT